MIPATALFAVDESSPVTAYFDRQRERKEMNDAITSLKKHKSDDVTAFLTHGRATVPVIAGILALHQVPPEMTALLMGETKFLSRPNHPIECADPGHCGR